MQEKSWLLIEKFRTRASNQSLFFVTIAQWAKKDFSENAENARGPLGT